MGNCGCSKCANASADNSARDERRFHINGEDTKAMGLLDDYFDPSQFQDIGSRLGAGFQGWAQTPAGSPFAALANGISAFNNVQSPSAASFIGPPAPTPVQTPDLGNRLGAAFQSWAQTPVGNPFAALANGVTGFNTGQTSVPNGASLVQPPTSSNSDRASAPIQGALNPAVSNAAPTAPVRRLAVIRRWSQ
jgi:hypothetical protein